jgi:hypothetical protein
MERTFTYDTDKDYKAVIVTVELSDALRYDFTGSPASRQFTRLGNSAHCATRWWPMRAAMWA